MSSRVSAAIRWRMSESMIQFSIIASDLSGSMQSLWYTLMRSGNTSGCDILADHVSSWEMPHKLVFCCNLSQDQTVTFRDHQLPPPVCVLWIQIVGMVSSPFDSTTLRPAIVYNVVNVSLSDVRG